MIQAETAANFLSKVPAVGVIAGRDGSDMSEQKYILTKISNKAQITATSDLLVGRRVEHGLKLTEGSPSSRHALLSMLDGSVWLHDLESTNGTYVNDRRIDSRVRLRSEDRLRFGAEDFLFQLDPTEPSEEINTNSSRLGPPRAWLSVGAPERGTRLVSAEELEKELERGHAALLRGESFFRKIDTPLLVFGINDAGLSRVQLSPTGKSEEQEWTVGSGPTCDVRIQVSSVSALHASIINDGKKWKVVSHMAANGVRVNKDRVLVKFLSSNDLIAFGSVECLFCLPQPPQPVLVAAGDRIKHMFESLLAPLKKARWQ
jgi:pSer/pThr/pTyr-binding forkhead associated (FHA) protein